MSFPFVLSRITWVMSLVLIDRKGSSLLGIAEPKLKKAYFAR
jgi:hypothetical protein